MPIRLTIAKHHASKDAEKFGHLLGEWRDGEALCMTDCIQCRSTLYVDVITYEVAGSGIVDRKCPGPRMTITP